MQTTDTFSQGGFPPSEGGNAVDIADQLYRRRRQHKRIQLLRSVRFWWYRILLIVLGGLIIAFLSPSVLDIWKIIIGVLVAAVAVFLAVRRVEFGLLMVSILGTAFFPVAFSIKSLNVYPAVPFLPLLFSVVLIQTAFRVRKPVFPSFRVIWPMLGLIVLTIVSNIIVQLTWTHTVPHKVINNPVIYDEILGVVLFCIPVIIFITTTAAITKKEQWIEYIQRALLVLSLFAAAIVTYEFRRIGSDIYAFRYTEPKILWMSLRALATLLALGIMIAYARFLYAPTWRMRLIYGGITVWCLASIYFTLENSWWLEVGVAMLVMTIVYSRRLFFTFCLLALPFIPVIKAELSKLAQAKSVDSLRFVIWQDALRVWSKQPVLGVGPGNFWTYDQRFTHLPILLADFQKTGLGVAHNGYLQALGELGPMGLFFVLALIFLIVLACYRLHNRSRAELSKLVPSTTLEKRLAKIGLHLYGMSEPRKDAILGLAALGLICGSAAADFTSGFFFLPPRQLGGFNDLSQVITAWIIWGCVAYKDQLWIMARKGEKLDDYK
jgi:O-antigen ligase